MEDFFSAIYYFLYNTRLQEKLIDQHASLSEKFLRKGFWLYLFTLFIAPIGYIIKIIISGEVSVSEVGILYGVISLITLLSAFSDMWVGESLKYFIPKFFEKKEFQKIKSILTYSLVTQLFTGSLLVSLVFFGADFISESYFKDPLAKPVIQVFSAFFLGINIFNIIAHFFLAVQNTLYYKICEFVRMFFILLSTIVILLNDIQSIVIFSSSWITGLYFWVWISVLLFVRKYYIPYFKGEKVIIWKKLLKQFFWYAFMVFLTAQAAIILSQIDMQMVIYLLGTENAGYYSIYLSLIMIPFLLIGPLFLILLPIFSELAAKKDIKKIQASKKLLVEFFTVTGIGISIFLFVFAEPISYILFWDTYLKSGEILQYSCLFLIFNLLYQINFNLLWGIGKIQSKLYITIVAIIINTILNVILIQYIWVAWAAFATGIWWLFIWIMSEYVLWTTYRVHYDIKFLVKNMLFMIIIGVIIYNYGIHIFEWASRGVSLWYLTIYILFSLIFFVLWNQARGKIFLKNIKDLKKS